jgi:hypothetical protein
VKAVTLFWTTFTLALLIVVVVVLIMGTHKLVPRLLIGIGIAFAFAIAMPQGKYPSDDLLVAGIVIAGAGIIVLATLGKQKRTPSDGAKPQDGTDN